MKSILFVSPTADSTGPTTSLSLLLSDLPNRYRVEVLVPGTGEFTEELSKRGIPWTSVPSLGRRQMPALYRFLRTRRFDLVYANETSGGSRNACIAAWLAGTPFVVHVRSMGWGKNWTRLGHLRLAQGVVAVSRACGTSIENYVGPERLHVIHNGVPIPARDDRYELEAARLRRELGLSPSHQLVVNVGHLSPRKNQLLAVQAMQRLVDECARVHLCFVGHGDRDKAYVERVRSAVHEAGLASHVSFLGFRSDIDLLLAGANVFFHTAVEDPHPRAVLEAMAVGVPVVAVSADGVAETVIHGKTGYLTSNDADEAAEALRRVLSDREAAWKMGVAGQTRVTRMFSEEKTRARIGHLLEQLLATR